MDVEFTHKNWGFDTDNADTTLVTKLFPAIMSLSWCAGAIGVTCLKHWIVSWVSACLCKKKQT